MWQRREEANLKWKYLHYFAPGLRETAETTVIVRIFRTRYDSILRPSDQ
jgi:hypothetical protein